ncbi:hypothetical protein HPQ64_20020 [Rhizobiales bacterium]|nr:hypothetical protein [Hongsoonwoonella zoysiae]NRG19988.1 hypothetical protein [Hongsoonwoonella zoysiae]
MNIINLTESEKSALSSIDESELRILIDQALHKEHSGDFRLLPLSNCGPYVATQLDRFERSFREYRESKSEKKIERTRTYAIQSGKDLLFAFNTMKNRMKTEEQERQTFQVDDNIFPPHRFSQKLQVTVSYRWRDSIEDEWAFGSITFHHEVQPQLAGSFPRPKRKFSAAKQEQILQDELFRTWEHLMSSALCSVRDYFKDGGDGSKIPSLFQVKTDQYTKGLNNYSTDFWRK